MRTPKGTFNFQPAAYIQDTRSLSLDARGAWADLLCAMWVNPERGRITKTVAEYARFFGCSQAQTERVLGEIVGQGVGDCYVSKNGTSRNMSQINHDRNTVNIQIIKLLHSEFRHAKITIENRKMLRDDRARKANALRQKERRGKMSQANHDRSTKTIINSLKNKRGSSDHGDPSLLMSQESKERERGSASDLRTPMSQGEKTVADAPSLSVFSSQITDEYLSELQSRELYAHLDVKLINEKMQLWCQANGNAPTRHRLLGWLNSEKANERARQNDDRNPIEQAKRVARKLGADH